MHEICSVFSNMRKPGRRKREFEKGFDKFREVYLKMGEI